MKKSITYREITLAIGILVAMVIAMTLWVTLPDEDVSGSNSSQQLNLPYTAKNLFETAVKIFPRITELE